MLQLQKITKTYKTGDLVQTALDGVSLSLRDNEFVSILGPSGSGKTTLLNVIGGLDRYDSGDLIINDVSTKKYKDKDWDSYRNHTIGFVFQSYNLIPHQSILSNVELALTISGIPRGERREKAKKALEEVGLGDQLHKKPNQMSGGQMQRVAIARALVNDPDILLADEPTGALDTDTGIQVMELLKKVASDRLVVMVTHNPELAEKYSTRIVKLRDGKIIDDSSPFDPDNEKLPKPEHKNLGRASMSVGTALSLSFNNLKTKKGRTALTSFAGSIGIIGISLILSLSTGVNNYITDIQKDTMSSYPISIKDETMDLASLMNISGSDDTKEAEHKLDKVYANNTTMQIKAEVTKSITKNNLADFKKYIESNKSKIKDYTGENGIIYSYDTKFAVFTHDSENTLVNTDGSTLSDESDGSVFRTSMSETMTDSNSMMSMMSDLQKNMYFDELLTNTKGELSSAVTDNYDVIYGDWPKNYDEVVFIINQNNEVPVEILYQFGLLPTSEYREISKNAQQGEEIELKEHSYSYEDICALDLSLIPQCDMYKKNDNGLYESIERDNNELDKLTDSALKLKITGVIRHKDESGFRTSDVAVIGYTKALTDHIIEYTNNSETVKAQKATPDTSILTGMHFAPKTDSDKAENTKKYFASLSNTKKASLLKSVLSQYESAVGGSAKTMMQQVSGMGDDQLVAMFDNYLNSADNDTLMTIYDKFIINGTYEDTLDILGVIDYDSPSEINIYTDTFENKDKISNCIKEYNESVEESDKITYTDYIGLLLSSITTIINVISYVLIAFVAVSLVVSSIMIGIITYISVLERTKEIGILRAIGASKRNISMVFNAETFLIGLFSGLMGIGITLILLIPANLFIKFVSDGMNVAAVLPIGGAVILVILSVVLTLIGGLIPSRKAAKKDPVIALRTE